MSPLTRTGHALDEISQLETTSSTTPESVRDAYAQRGHSTDLRIVSLCVVLLRAE